MTASAAVLAARMADTWVYRHATVAGLNDPDLWRLLRLAGYLPVWMVVAAGMAAARGTGWRALRRQPEGRLVIAAAAGGALAEVLKILVRSERPGLHDGLHHLRPWSAGPLSTASLGMPSGHTLVAFSAAAMLDRSYPRGRVLWFALAAGCAATRVISGAHFLSDAVAAAALGPVVAAAVARWLPADTR